MAGNFEYDVFLSHSPKDKNLVLPIAERLRKAGLRVWFDAWEIKPRAAKTLRAKKTAEGLSRSRVLVLCMSANAFGPDWPELEAGTFRFRDPLNNELRFVPLRLDNASIKGSLAQFLYIDWVTDKREQEYAKLLASCRSIEQRTASASLASRERPEDKVTSQCHTDAIRSVAFSPDGTLAISGPFDNTARIRDVSSGSCIRVFEGHSSYVASVAWRHDGNLAISGSYDNTARIWNVNTGSCIRVLKGHLNYVWSVAWSPDGTQAISGSTDQTARIWDVDSGSCIQVLEGHSGAVMSVD